MAGRMKRSTGGNRFKSWISFLVFLIKFFKFLFKNSAEGKERAGGKDFKDNLNSSCQTLL